MPRMDVTEVSWVDNNDPIIGWLDNLGVWETHKERRETLERKYLTLEQMSTFQDRYVNDGIKRCLEHIRGCGNMIRISEVDYNCFLTLLSLGLIRKSKKNTDYAVPTEAAFDPRIKLLFTYLF